MSEVIEVVTDLPTVIEVDVDEPTVIEVVDRGPQGIGGSLGDSAVQFDEDGWPYVVMPT